MKRSDFIRMAGALLLGVSGAAMAQDPGAPKQPGQSDSEPWFKKKKKSENVRHLSGFVKDPDGNVVEGAVVKLKDTKTLDVRSFITLEDGAYRFSGLDLDTDYELQASHSGASSKTRRVSVYDNRKKLSIVLQLRPKA